MTEALEVQEGKLWDDVRKKLKKSGRRFAEIDSQLAYRYAELFCEKCGKSLGEHDIVSTNLESEMYCGDCVKPYIRECPIELDCGTILSDYGNDVKIKYTDNYYSEIVVFKTCYFNRKGRYIKVKGKRYYV